MAPATLEKEDHARDAQFSKVLHGKSTETQAGFLAMRNKDAQAQKAAVDEYFKHWDNKSAADETDETRAVSFTDTDGGIYIYVACFRILIAMFNDIGAKSGIRNPDKAVSTIWLI